MTMTMRVNIVLVYIDPEMRNLSRIYNFSISHFVLIHIEVSLFQRKVTILFSQF